MFLCTYPFVLFLACFLDSKPALDLFWSRSFEWLFVDSVRQDRDDLLFYVKTDPKTVSDVVG